MLLKSVLLFANYKLFYIHIMHIWIYVYISICIWIYVRISIQIISVSHFPRQCQWSEFSADTGQSSLNSSFPNPGSSSQPLFHRFTPPTPPTSQRLPWHDSPGITALHTHIKLLKPQCVLRQSTVSLSSPTTKTNKTNPDFKICILYHMYMSVLPVCMYMHHDKPGIHTNQKRVLDNLEVGLPRAGKQWSQNVTTRLSHPWYSSF